MTTFNNLPEAVQKDVIDTLTFFVECHVTYEYGKYKAVPGIACKAVYAPDHKYLGCFTKKNVTADALEQIAEGKKKEEQRQAAFRYTN